MYAIGNLFKQEPAAIAAVLAAVLPLLVVFGVVDMDADQIAGIEAAVVLVLGLFVRQSVTPSG